MQAKGCRGNGIWNGTLFFLSIVYLGTGCNSPSSWNERSRSTVSEGMPRSVGDVLPQPHGELNEDQKESRIDDRDLFAGQNELSLETLVAEVLGRNPSVSAAFASWRAAAERYPQVIALDDPMLGFMVGPQSFGTSKVDSAWMVEASQRFPWPGKLGLRGEVARHEAEAAYHEVEDVRLRLTEATRMAFYDYYVVRREQEVTVNNSRAVEELRDIAKTKYEASLVPQQDALQAEVELAELERRHVELEQKDRIAIARINTLLHRRPDHALPPPPARIDEPAALPAIETLWGVALERRPDLASLREKVRAEEAGTRLASREFFPDFELVGRYDAFWQEEELRPGVGMNIVLPLQIGRRRAALSEARSRLMRESAELESLMDRVLFEVQAAFERVRESQRVVRLYLQSIIPAAEQNLESARAGYVAGSVDFLRLIEAQRQLYRHQERRYEALSDYHQRLAELERVLAGPVPEARAGDSGSRK